MPNQPPQNLTIATTGASGSLFLQTLPACGRARSRVQTINFIASDSALRVLAEELGIKGRSNLVGQISARRERRTFAKAPEEFFCRSPAVQ